jgi:chemotaxis response regulator CheB
VIRIGIVNDLRLAVEALRRAVALIPEASIAWVAEDGAQAVDACARDLPDVVLMDMLMPVMDGVEATRVIMQRTPCPILVVTATVEGNAGKVFEALGAGAMDAVATPTLTPDGRPANAEPLIRKIRAISLLTGGTRSPSPAPAPASPDATAVIPPLLAVGASTGGPLALVRILQSIPHPAPWPIVIVQHVDLGFAEGLASWLGAESGHAVRPVRQGETPVAGQVFIAATDDHLVLDAHGAFRYSPDPVDEVFRPSVDVFFGSLLRRQSRPGVAVVLTGMGRDGAAGMLKLKNAGWHTIAQSKESSVVWGMPGACVELGAASQVLPLSQIAMAIVARMPVASP